MGESAEEEEEEGDDERNGISHGRREEKRRERNNCYAKEGRLNKLCLASAFLWPVSLSSIFLRLCGRGHVAFLFVAGHSSVTKVIIFFCSPIIAAACTP